MDVYLKQNKRKIEQSKSSRGLLYEDGLPNPACMIVFLLIVFVGIQIDWCLS